MSERSSLSKSACGGCGEDVGAVHTCPKCSVSMYPFCGTPVGQEGYGQPVLCPSCDGRAVKKIYSASSIIAAFDRVSTCATADPNLSPAIATSAGADSSSKEQTTESALPSAHTNAVATTSSRRSTQIVSTVKQQVKVVQWLVEMERRGGIKGLLARPVDEFPEIFRSESCNSNLAKASSWWKKREKILNLPKGTRELSTRRHDGRMRANRKALAGRGRRRSKWVIWLYAELLDEFDRLRKLGLKFDASVLRQVALRLLKASSGPYTISSVDGNGALIKDKLLQDGFRRSWYGSLGI